MSPAGPDEPRHSKLAICAKDPLGHGRKVACFKSLASPSTQSKQENCRNSGQACPPAPTELLILAVLFFVDPNALWSRY